MSDQIWSFQEGLSKSGFSQLPPINSLVEARKKLTQQEQEKKAPKKKTKWATAFDQTFELDFSLAQPFPDISTIDWSKEELIGVQRSSGGAEGTFFVETKKGTFIVKRSFNISAEVLCSLLALRLGLNAPRVRVFKTDGEEGDMMLSKLKEKDGTGRVMTTLAPQGYVIFMEFVRGLTLNLLPFRVAQEIFRDTNALEELGALLALDVITNNCDRLPLIWPNQGNESNVMITESGGKVISIDAKIIPIDPEKNKDIFDDYLEKVEDLVQVLSENPGQESAQFRLVRDVITGCTGWDIDTEGTLRMQKGFIDVVDKCAKMDFKKELSPWLEALKQKGLEVNENIVSFLETIIDALVRVKQDPSKRVTVSGTSKKKKQDVLATKKANIVIGLSPSNPDASESASHKPVASSVVKSEYPWSRVSVPHEKPSARRYFSSFMHQGKMYSLGGETVQGKSLSDFYVFDFEQSRWSIVPVTGATPSARWGHSTVIHNDTLYVYGGQSSTTDFLDDFFSFNFQTRQWTQIAKQTAWPGPRSFQSATVINDSFYLFGGQTGPSSYSDELFQFSFATGQWTSVSQKTAPSARAGHIAFAHESMLYVYGGNKGDQEQFPEMHAFNLGNGAWHEVDISGSLPRTSRPLTSVSNSKGVVYVFGGFDGQNPLGSILEFHLSNHKWYFSNLYFDDEQAVISGVSSEPAPRYGHGTVINDKGLISIFGGSGKTAFLNDIMQIDTEAEDDE